MDYSKVLNMKLSERLYEDLKIAAERKGISLAGLVRMICTEWLEETSSNNAVVPRATNVAELFAALPGEVRSRSERVV
jgi:predicted DNA-binding ribbon-helix-helix protein